MAHFRRIRWAAALGVAILSFSVGQTSAGEDWQAGAGEEWRRVLAAARQEGKVVVAGPPALAQAFSTGFKRDTGIELEYLGGESRELSSRLSREAKSGNLTIDLSLGGGTELLTLHPQGLLVALKPQLLLPGVTEGKHWIGGAAMWMDNEGKYLLRGSRYVVGWPLVNAAIVDPSAIRSWKDLLKPEFKGKIAAYDPRSGGPGQGVAGYLADTFGIDFVKQLYQGQNVRYTRDSQQLVEWAARGVHPIVLGSIQSVVERFRAQGFKLTALAPEDGPGYLSSGFSVLKQAKGVPHPHAATVFINWYASHPGQEAYSRIMLEASTRADVKAREVPDYVKPKPGVKYPDTYIENWYRDVRPKVAKSVVQALGGK